VSTCAPFLVTRLLENFASVRKAVAAREVVIVVFNSVVRVVREDGFFLVLTRSFVQTNPFETEKIKIITKIKMEGSGRDLLLRSLRTLTWSEHGHWIICTWLEILMLFFLKCVNVNFDFRFA
jgi:hypothetical protein